jgi:serine phosphatase RsbU (regulator of sigma subunit)
MYPRLEGFCQRLWPELAQMPDQRRAISVGDMLGSLYALPIALAGLVWLATASQWERLWSEWPLSLALLLLLWPFNRLSFFVVAELRPGSASDVASSLEGVLIWASALYLGPVGLWFGVLSGIGRLVNDWRREQVTSARLSLVRNELFSLVETSVACLAGLWLYRLLGGVTPFPGLNIPGVILAGLLATAGRFLFGQLVSLPFLLLLMFLLHRIDPLIRPVQLLRFQLVTTVLMASGQPFAVLAAGLYSEHGIWIFLFLMAGLLVVSYLAHRLSKTALRSQRQASLLEGLETLSRALLITPPEEEAQLAVIRERILNRSLHFPGRLEIRLFPERVVVHEPPHFEAVPEAAWEWLKQNPGDHNFVSGTTLPWGGRSAERCTALVEIVDEETHEMSGGIYLSISTRGYFDQHLFEVYIPILQTLADQLALALNRAKVARQNTGRERMEQELRLAGEIQGSFLPDHFPQVEGWRLSAMLVSARDTSGDFFDFIALPDGQVGIIVADVADKGLGAALYMALSRAYLRSHILGASAEPASALLSLNRRVLEDTSSDLFVTVFYVLVAPHGASLVYSNGGHPPALVVRVDPERPSEWLVRTGMAVGAVEEAEWNQVVIAMEPGDFAVLYSDGLTDAVNAQGQAFGVGRLKETAEALRGQPPYEVRVKIMDTLREFSGGVQDDDVTVVVLGREIG